MRIDLHHLKKNYGNRKILNINRLTFESGKIIGLSGSNGAGKTTLLRIIAGLDSHYEGEVYRNEQLDFTPELRKQITYLSQRPYMMQGSVKENLSYPLLLRKAEERAIKDKVEAILEELGIEHLADQKAASLSGGEAQKLALARALIFEPKLLLLDEPTASIDAQTIAHIESILKKRNQSLQMTMVMISHNKAQLTGICDHLIEMEGGTCIQSVL